MIRGRRLLLIGLVAAFAIAGGTAWALSDGDDSESARWLQPTGTLLKGVAPSGDKYELSFTSAAENGHDPAEAVCTELRGPESAAQGCHPVPDADGTIGGRPWRPSMATLGSDRFFLAVAPQGVSAMEVAVAGDSKAATSEAVDAGPVGRLLIV